MTAEQAIRFIDHQARRCRDRDSHEALCLLSPALLKALDLQPMDSFEALDFTVELREALRRAD
jgi:hypothetical protein